MDTNTLNDRQYKGICREDSRMKDREVTGTILDYRNSKYIVVRKTDPAIVRDKDLSISERTYNVPYLVWPDSIELIES